VHPDRVVTSSPPTTTDPAAEVEPLPADIIETARQLAILVETNPDSPVLLAVRLALEVADGRRAARRARREAGLDVHSALTPEQWRRWAENHVPHAEIARRRAEPGPLAPKDGPRDDVLNAG
jgi:hypothetical protein